jgi:hypothetical protein
MRGLLDGLAFSFEHAPDIVRQILGNSMSVVLQVASSAFAHASAISPSCFGRIRVSNSRQPRRSGTLPWPVSPAASPY